MSGSALALAVVGALGYGTASVLQAVGARGAASTVATVLAPAYLLGTALDLLAWLASLAALRSLPVFEVQAVLAGSLAVTAVLARFTLGSLLGAAGWLGIVIAVAAIAVLAAAADPGPISALSGRAGLLLALAAVPLAGAGVAAAGAGRSLLCGALAGLAFGGAALCARAVALPTWAAAHERPHLLLHLLTQPLAWGLAGFGVTGMLLYAHALEGGDTARVTALLWITEVVVPSVVGVLLLGDAVRPGWAPAALAAVAACLAACWLLAARGPDDPGQPLTATGAATAARG